MTFDIPHPLKAEHEQLHATLVDATREPGEVGTAAREVARLLHPHFVHEEEFALPPLALLEPIARSGVTQDMASVLPMTRRLKAQLPQMLPRWSASSPHHARRGSRASSTLPLR
jgi:hypothetical protein